MVIFHVLCIYFIFWEKWIEIEFEILTSDVICAQSVEMLGGNWSLRTIRKHKENKLLKGSSLNYKETKNRDNRIYKWLFGVQQRPRPGLEISDFGGLWILLVLLSNPMNQNSAFHWFFHYFVFLYFLDTCPEFVGFSEYGNWRRAKYVFWFSPLAWFHNHLNLSECKNENWDSCIKC